LRPFIRLRSTLTQADYNEETGKWISQTDNNETFKSTYVVLATGVLSTSQTPNIPGLHDFSRRLFHTGTWPKEPVRFRGRHVAVIGTGSSGTQIIPVVAEDAEHLTVFQRTANYVMPSRNAPLDEETVRDWKDTYPERRAYARASKNGHNQK